MQMPSRKSFTQGLVWAENVVLANVFIKMSWPHSRRQRHKLTQLNVLLSSDGLIVSLVIDIRACWDVELERMAIDCFVIGQVSQIKDTLLPMQVA